ncbi:MAG: MerR family transcriptional regulator [Paludibacteraceae bacterium]|nr:MerR family transcriptional regulator [Paludibacteraceae bacterium]
MSKLYYSISEVAEMLNVNQSLLRFWEKEFETFIKPHKNAKGTRFYKEEDIDTIKLIHYLVRVQGLTLSGAKKKIKENKTSALKNQEIHSRLSSIKEELLSIKKLLSRQGEEEGNAEDDKLDDGVLGNEELRN